MLNSYYTSTR